MIRLVGLVVAASLVIAACATTGSGASAPPAGSAASAPAAASAGSVTIGTAATSLGTVLVGPTGLTLYTHAGDTASSSTCTGGCLAAWPPLAVSSGHQATAGPGVSGQLATLVRPEGTTQVTYNGLPLYYWQGDTKPGDVTGQGKGGFSVAKAMGAAPGSGGAASPSASGYGY